MRQYAFPRHEVVISVKKGRKLKMELLLISFLCFNLVTSSPVLSDESQTLESQALEVKPSVQVQGSKFLLINTYLTGGPTIRQWPKIIFPHPFFAEPTNCKVF